MGEFYNSVMNTAPADMARHWRLEGNVVAVQAWRNTDREGVIMEGPSDADILEQYPGATATNGWGEMFCAGLRSTTSGKRLIVGELRQVPGLGAC